MGNGQATEDSLIRELHNRGYDIKPVTDQSPFFYKFNNTLPSSLLNVFYFSIIAVAIFALLPFLFFVLKKHKTGSAGKPDSRKYLWFSIYFAMIGSGFMLIEVTMIQRIMLVLGNPVYAMSTIIFTMLTGAGFGSLASSRISLHKLHKYMIRTCCAVVCLILLYQFSLPSIIHFMSTGSTSFKTFVAVILVFPLGFVMGFPLPMAVRLIKLFNMSEMIPWVLAINGASSIFGSALTVVLAMTFGYGHAFLAAAFCYGVVLLSACLVAADLKQEILNGKIVSLAPAVGNNL
jgi:predicted membrane-bound spermidine synthase